MTTADRVAGGPFRRDGVRASSSGFTVVEMLVTLLLLTLVLGLAWRTGAVQRRSFVRLLERQAELDAERLILWVLNTEIGGVTSSDWDVPSPGVFRLRAYRGWAIPCAPAVDPNGWLPVRMRSWRVPDPSKDSLLLLDTDGRRWAVDLVGRSWSPAPCVPRGGERVEWWRLGGGAGRPVRLVRYYESGSYHLEDRAFRYRRGAGGRQPLTAEVLDPAGSGLERDGDDLRVRFRPWRFGGLPTPDPGWVRSLRGGR